MEQSAPHFQRYLFVCTNTRDKGLTCCSPQGLETGAKIREALKTKVKEAKASHIVRVSSSGCQDSCLEGPNILVYPDNIWLKGVRLEDVDRIVEEFVLPLKKSP